MSEDKVRLIDQERLDLPDARDLQGLVYTYVREAIGGLMGQAQGCLSAPTFTRTNDGVTYLLIPSSFVFIQTSATLASAEPQGAFTIQANRAWDGIVHTFDSSQSGHVNYPIDYTAARAAEIATPGTVPFIWARPIEVDLDTDTRRVWDVGTQTEIPTPINTRTRMRVEFAISETVPAGDDWARIARIAWSGTIPEPVWISAWDDPDLADLTQDPDPFDPSAAESSSMAAPFQRVLTGGQYGDDGTVNDYPPGSNRSAGLLYHLHRIRSQIQRVLSGGSSDDPSAQDRAWWQIPTLSLAGLKVVTDGLAAFNSGVVQPVLATYGTLLTQLTNRHVVLAAGVLRWQAGIYAAPYNTPGWVMDHGWGVERVDTDVAANRAVSIKFRSAVTNGRTGFRITSIVTSPVYNPAWTFPGFDLRPEMIPVNSGDPTLFTAGTLNDYRGAAVGLAAGEYGVRFILTRALAPAVVPGALTGLLPPNGGIPTDLAFSFQILISTYSPSEAGA